MTPRTIFKHEEKMVFIFSLTTFKCECIWTVGGNYFSSGAMTGKEYQALPQIIPTWHKWWSHHMHLALWTLSALWHCIITSHIGSRKRMKQTIKIAVDRMSFIKTNNSRIEINAIKPCPRFHSLIFFYLVLLPFSSSSFHTEVNITKGLLQSCYLAILRLQDFINTEGLNQRSFFKKHPVLTFEVLKRGKKCYYLK